MMGRALLGLLFVIVFYSINRFVWGDGYDVTFLGITMDGYGLINCWVILIALLWWFGVFMEEKRHIPAVISIWWLFFNIGTTTILNWISPRGVQEAGDVWAFAGMELPSLVLDYTAQGTVDFIALVVVSTAALKRWIPLTVPLLIFAVFLLGNIAAYTVGTWGLALSRDVSILGYELDAFTYMWFTALLLLVALWSAADELLKLRGLPVDLYRDWHSPAGHAFRWCVSRTRMLARLARPAAR